MDQWLLVEVHIRLLRVVIAYFATFPLTIGFLLPHATFQLVIVKGILIFQAVPPLHGLILGRIRQNTLLELLLG